jgi:hypothetical protein
VKSLPGAVKYRALCLALLLLASLIPLVIVQVMPTDSPEPYLFKARFEGHLGTSSNGSLTYHQVSVLEGEAPASTVVVALDRNYTRGLCADITSPGAESWLQGSLMTREVYYGEQYLFFGPPQIYVRQLKSGMLWPDQTKELSILYLSPLSTIFAPIQIPFLLRSDGLSARTIGTLLARCALLIATIIFVLRRRNETAPVLSGLLTYAVVAMLLTLPILADLY